MARKKSDPAEARLFRRALGDGLPGRPLLLPGAEPGSRPHLRGAVIADDRDDPLAQGPHAGRRSATPRCSPWTGSASSRRASTPTRGSRPCPWSAGRPAGAAGSVRPAPAGPLVAVATRPAGPRRTRWTRRIRRPSPRGCCEASERGLWHDWWVTDSTDVARAPELMSAAAVDLVEADDPSSSHHDALRHYEPTAGRLTVTVDVTWLGPYETGRAGAHHGRPRRARAAGRPSPRSGSSASRSCPPTRATSPAIRRSSSSARTSRCRCRTSSGTPTRSTDAATSPRHAGSGPASSRPTSTSSPTTSRATTAPPEAWHAYRALQRRIALSVDGITTISADVAHRLLEEVPRLETDRVLPLPLGLDHIRAEQAPDAPGEDLDELVKSLRGKRFVAVLGNDFQHKNRDFAIKVWEATLQAGQPCDLVLAGLHVKSSSSKVQEDDLTARHLDLRGRIHSVGHVSAQSRAWLLANATAVLYPTSAEGFGFVPYEAAALGAPTVFTDFGPLAEISGVARPAVGLVDRAVRRGPRRPAVGRGGPRRPGGGPAGRHRSAHVGRASPSSSSTSSCASPACPRWRRVRSAPTRRRRTRLPCRRSCRAAPGGRRSRCAA